MFAPKGIGVLVVRRRNRRRPPLSPLMFGGGQERGYRPGTLSVPLAASFGLNRFLATLLFGVKTSDPITYAAVAIILVSVAFLAAYIPARRATKIDPLVALRYE